MQASVNELFDAVFVVSLARRKDRWRRVSAELAAAGIDHQRFAATDGKDPEIERDWRAYAAGPLAAPPAGAPPIRSALDFWRGHHAPAARLAWFEARDGRKAIATPGAWGLLLSMERLLAHAQQAGWSSILIFEDDVRLHRDFGRLWPRMLAQLPQTWAIFQLGAMQLHWEEGWLDWHSENLYRCGGSSLAAHAIGLRAEAIPTILEACRRRDMPFDVGALNEAKRIFAPRAFTCFPNLAIQDGADSEINSSAIFAQEMRKADNVYRWDFKNYGLATPGAAVLRMSGAAPAPPMGAGQLPARVDAPGAPVVLAMLFGLDDATYRRTLDILARQFAEGAVVPVVLTERSDFADLRAVGLPFEFVRDPRASAAIAPDLPWDLRLLRRLRLLRLKWRPARVVPFGPESARILDLWRMSPFEQDHPGPDLGTEGAAAGAPGAEAARR